MVRETPHSVKSLWCLARLVQYGLPWPHVCWQLSAGTSGGDQIGGLRDVHCPESGKCSFLGARDVQGQKSCRTKVS